jgi:hypothetical protein
MVGLVRVGPERRRPGVGPGRDAAGWSDGAPGMDEITRILSAIERGDEQAAEQLLPLVYDELRNLAAQKLAQEKPGQTLLAMALVHEVYLRLAEVAQVQRWNSRGQCFAAAAESMRGILIQGRVRNRAESTEASEGVSIFDKRRPSSPFHPGL